MLQLHSEISKRLIEPMLKPIRIDRGIVRVRRVINKIMVQPIRFDNVELSTRKAQYIDHNGKEQTTIIEGRITTRIEKYANKTRVLVFTNVHDDFLKPYKRTILL